MVVRDLTGAEVKREQPCSVKAVVAVIDGPEDIAPVND